MSIPADASAKVTLDDARIRVLFLCTANSARSQTAEALLCRKGGSRFVVGSAGTSPADVVRAGALKALAKIGIDWSHARPKHLDRVVSESWDLVITLCDRVRETCPSFAGRPVTAHWGIPDPALSIEQAAKIRIRGYPGVDIVERQ